MGFSPSLISFLTGRGETFILVARVGILSLCPGVIRLIRRKRFNLAMEEIEVLYRRAIPERVSPLRTLCRKEVVSGGIQVGREFKAIKALSR